jgi:hypothetical protein
VRFGNDRRSQKIRADDGGRPSLGEAAVLSGGERLRIEKSVLRSARQPTRPSTPACPPTDGGTRAGLTAVPAYALCVFAQAFLRPREGADGDVEDAHVFVLAPPELVDQTRRAAAHVDDRVRGRQGQRLKKTHGVFGPRLKPARSGVRFVAVDPPSQCSWLGVRDRGLEVPVLRRAWPLGARSEGKVAERVGFEPTWRLTAHPISSRRRYDRFGTSPLPGRFYHPSFFCSRSATASAAAGKRIVRATRTLKRVPRRMTMVGGRSRSRSRTV